MRWIADFGLSGCGNYCGGYVLGDGERVVGFKGGEVWLRCLFLNDGCGGWGCLCGFVFMGRGRIVGGIVFWGAGWR